MHRILTALPQGAAAEQAGTGAALMRKVVQRLRALLNKLGMSYLLPPHARVPLALCDGAVGDVCAEIGRLVGELTSAVRAKATVTVRIPALSLAAQPREQRLTPPRSCPCPCSCPHFPFVRLLCTARHALRARPWPAGAGVGAAHC